MALGATAALDSLRTVVSIELLDAIAPPELNRIFARRITEPSVGGNGGAVLHEHALGGTREFVEARLRVVVGWIKIS